MKNFSRTQKGDFLVFLSIIPWAFFPVFTKISYSTVPVLFSAGMSSLLGGVVAGVTVGIQKRWRDFGASGIAWRHILAGSFIIGIAYYGILFWGLQRTSAGNASIIGLMEVFFTFLFFRLYRKERHKSTHLWGAVLMVLGAACILFPGTFQFHRGDIVILFAAMIPPLGNYHQKEARKYVSTAFLLFIRSIISGIILMLLSMTFESFPGFGDISSSGLVLLLNGVFAFGVSKLIFLESYHYISVSRAIALLSLTPVFTLLIAYFLLQEIPTIWQIFGLIPVVAGTFLLMFDPEHEFD